MTYKQEIFEKNIRFFRAFQLQLSVKYNLHKPKRCVPCLTDSNVNIHDTEKDLLLYKNDPALQSKEQVDAYEKNPTPLPISFGNHSNKFFLCDRYSNALADKLGTTKVVGELGVDNGLFIVFGIGLGHHVTEILNRYKPRMIVVIEAHDDVFYSSLHATDWSEVSAKANQLGTQISFINNDNPDMVIQTLRHILLQAGLHYYINGFIYAHSNDPQTSKLIQAFSNSTNILVLSDGFFEDERLGLSHCTANLEADLPVMLKKDLKQKAPLIIVGNGPSLDNDIAWLKKNRHKAIVCSAGTTLFTLYKHNIKPDLHFEMERGEVVYDGLVANLPKKYLKSIDFVTLCTSHPKTCKLFKNTYLVTKDADINIPFIKALVDVEVAIPRHMNPTVSNFIFSFACSAGFQEIYLVGVDLGSIDKEKHHASKSSYYDDKAGKKHSFNDDMYIEVEGNCRHIVYTSKILLKSRVSFSCLFYEMEHRPQVYNLSDGVKIDGTITKKSSDVVLKKHVQKVYISKMLKKLFKKPMQGADLRYCIRKELQPAYDFLCKYKLPEILPDKKELFNYFSALDKYVNTMKLDSNRLIKGTLGNISYIVYGLLNSGIDQEKWNTVRFHTLVLIQCFKTMFDSYLFECDLNTAYSSFEEIFKSL